MKDAYYFSHDANAQNDEKILELRADYGWEGYGLFWAIIEIMRNQSNYKLKHNDRLPKKLAIQLNVDQEFIKNFIEDCIEYELFKKEDGYIYSESLMRRMKKYKKRRDAARKAAEARWNSDSNKAGNGKGSAKEKQKQCDRIADALLTQSKSNASKVKESKVKESKVKEKDLPRARAIIDIFNLWKELLSDVNDARLTKNLIKKIITKLKKWSAEDIVSAINNYNEIYRSDYYYKHHWTLQKFIEQSNGAPRFLEGLNSGNDGDIWKDYKKWENNNKNPPKKDTKEKEAGLVSLDEYEEAGW